MFYGLIRMTLMLIVTMKNQGRQKLYVSGIQAQSLRRMGPNQLFYTYIKGAKSFFDVPREKLSPRPLRPRQDNLKVVKGFHVGFRSHSVHNILSATENL
jgi:hypothetical protein